MNVQRLIAAFVATLVCLPAISQEAQESNGTESDSSVGMSLHPLDNPASWIRGLQYAHSARLSQVDHYVERIRGNEIPGLRASGPPGNENRCLANCRVFATVDVTLPNGETLGQDHQLTQNEVAILAGTSPNAMSLASMSLGYGAMQDFIAANADEMLGDFAPIADSLFGETYEEDGRTKRDISRLTNREVVDDIEEKTFDQSDSTDPFGQSEFRESPWLNPFRMFGGGSYMLYEAAEGVAEAERSLAETGNQALAEAQRKEDALAGAELAGMEVIQGQPAMHIRMPVPDDAESPMQLAEGQSFQPTLASLWIRPETFVITKHRVEGLATAEGETREFFIEAEYSDFREVPDSEMYKPYRRVMRMGGVMNDEQMAQMEEARRQLEEFDQQLAAMSPQERQMVENMMGSQMDTLRSMSDGGTLEYVEVIDEILVNPDLKALFGTGMESAQMLPSADNLLARIQTDLVTLGYEPGNTAGVLDTMTQVAISQFQAESGLEVTGEPSQALANALATAVAGQ